MISVIDIIGDIVRGLNEKVGFPVNYIFGDRDYIAKALNQILQTPETERLAFPFICLYPFVEDRTDRNWHCKTSLDLIMAVDTQADFTNEMRKDISFKQRLHPVYNAFIEAILKDKRLDFAGYGRHVPHQYSENYRYGHFKPEMLHPEFKHRIDAIDLTRVQINVKGNCNGKN